MAENEGKLDELKGRIRRGYGELTDDQEQKDKGTIDKATGKVKEGLEKARDKANELIERREEKKDAGPDKT